jgi:hypothetical protein
MNIELPEVGYAPQNLTTLLYATLPDVRNRREWLATRLDVKVDAVHRWCVQPTSKRHVNMSLKNWRKTQSITEAHDTQKRLNLPYVEAGYTPQNLTTLLFLALPNVTARREWLAQKLGVTLDTVHRWCVELTSKRHVDMSLVKWRRALVVTEADHDLMKLELRDLILSSLPENLHDRFGGNQPKGWLAVSYHGCGKWQINFFDERSDKNYDLQLNIGFNKHFPRAYHSDNLNLPVGEIVAYEPTDEEIKQECENAELAWENRDHFQIKEQDDQFNNLRDEELSDLLDDTENSVKAYLNPRTSESYTEEEMNYPEPPKLSDDEYDAIETSEHIAASISEWIDEIFNVAGPKA